MKENHISVWRALFGWIDQPKKTLRHVVQETRWSLWLAPALAIVLALVIATLVSAPSASEFARQQAEQQMASQMGQLSGEQAEQVERSLETFTSPLFIGATGIALGTLGLILTWLFRGALLFFIAYLLGTDTRYVQMVTLALWCWLPFALRDLVQAAYVLINGQLPVNRGLSFLVASSDQVQNAGNLAYGFLSQVDPFLAWHLILVAIGLTVTTRSTTLKTSLGTIGYWAVTALVGLAPSLLGTLTSSAF
ncbi:MAG: YIP1 family protein [Anaerolineae bacterium]